MARHALRARHPDRAGAGRDRTAGPLRPGTARPSRPAVPLVSCAAVLLAWALVAHNGGAGWVQAVGDVLGGALVVGLAAPGVVVARARLELLDAPLDAAAGLPAQLGASATTRLRVRPLVPPGPECFVGPHGPVGLGTGRGRGRRWDASGAADDEWITLLPAQRGVHHHVLVEIATAAPFGLLWWRRRVVVALPRELTVAPRLGAAVAVRRGRDDAAGEGARRAPVLVGEPRGVRPYRPGDNRRWVHWPGTAHSGELMVREMEGPTGDPVTVEVRLPPGDEAAEQAAEQAFGTVVALLDGGSAVVMATTEASGPKVGAVTDRRSAGRRLARAVAEEPAGVGGATGARGARR